mmetsp:Transcript_25313/g.51491  ORF Transcript_25313/g.51491 Transcript_25313/m.51491 type:complete len:160 (-) Transcript_25313:2544-3023(-)
MSFSVRFLLYLELIVMPQICMSEFLAGEVIVVTPCEHIFHKRCCNEWLQHSRTCPYCRADLPDALGMNEESTIEELQDVENSVIEDGRQDEDGDHNNGIVQRNSERREFRQNLLRVLRRERSQNDVHGSPSLRSLNGNDVTSSVHSSARNGHLSTDLDV